MPTLNDKIKTALTREEFSKLFNSETLKTLEKEDPRGPKLSQMSDELSQFAQQVANDDTMLSKLAATYQQTMDMIDRLANWTEYDGLSIGELKNPGDAFDKDKVKWDLRSEESTASQSATLNERTLARVIADQFKIKLATEKKSHAGNGSNMWQQRAAQTKIAAVAQREAAVASASSLAHR